MVIKMPTFNRALTELYFRGTNSFQGRIAVFCLIYFKNGAKFKPQAFILID